MIIVGSRWLVIVEGPIYRVGQLQADTLLICPFFDDNHPVDLDVPKHGRGAADPSDLDAIDVVSLAKSEM